jgi:hypothetical protein
MGQAIDQPNQARGGIRSLTFYLAAQAEENKVLVFFEASPMNKARCSSRKSKTSEK